MYKCAIVGVSGKRAIGLAEAYQYVERGSLVAVSTRTGSKLHEFADRFDVSARYTDYRVTFINVQPDQVHVKTPPTVRQDYVAPFSTTTT